MTEFERLAEKGAQLVVARDKAAGHERYMLNKEIKSIKQKQLAILAADIIEEIKPQIPQIVANAIKAAGLEKTISKLQTNAAAMGKHIQQGVPMPDEYFSPDPEFMADVEAKLCNHLTAAQQSYFNNLTDEQADYFADAKTVAGVDLETYFVRKDS
ncbi:hypothetical protein KG826_000716 [Escherichia coli]|nr:hypothetical protein [Escherichia coli]